MNFKKENLIKSPFNYTGGKYKLLSQIFPYFPNDIDKFIDLFSGGCNIGINVKANHIICNDINHQVISFMNTLKQYDKEFIFKELLLIIDNYKLSDSTINSYDYYNCNSLDGLSNYNKKNYLNLRNYYNSNLNIEKFKKDMIFYILCCYSFSNQIRFNSKGEFNMPYGKRDFNNNMRKNLSNYIDRIKEINIDFYNNDFKNINIDDFNSNDFIYCDPPYLITCASYNEKNGWNEILEKELLEILDYIDKKGIKFALSNVLENKGKSNDILKEWSKKYNTYHLTHTYANCNYHAKDKNKTNTDEVLITNYKQ